MKRTILILATLALVSSLGTASAALIAGVDFSDGAGNFDITPDDLNATDMISVSAWTFENGGNITNDGNSQAGRVSAPVGKFDGENGGLQPAVGAAPPVNNVHWFSITIPDGVIVNLTNVKFSYSQATDGIANVRWLAFRTSLDSELIFSEVGPFRPALDDEDILLTDARYTNLTDQTVQFLWYAGGSGTGDIDIDSIQIEGTVIPEPSVVAILALGGLGFLLRRRR